ncbi:hypothetical protein ACH4L5_34325 [Streptomyces sp. NPDC017405]|uniref:hypothetical protein n=1 Tax=unclassified Streptomyces TaxID=2593676 RepID=UPI003799FE53
MTFGAGGRAVAGLGSGRLRSPLGMGLRALAGRVTFPLRRREGAQNVNKVQELPELAPGLVQVADHPVLAPADLPVLLTQSGDTPLDLFEELQPALRKFAVQCCQPDSRIVETFETRELFFYGLQFLHRFIERVFPPHVTP